MEVRIAFTRNDKSFISRAIMWFTQRKTHPDRRCSHVFLKFEPEGVLGKVEPWAVFEAMERGCWLSPYSKSLGSQTVVAEFSLKGDHKHIEWSLEKALENYLDWHYDYAGIGIWAIWIMAKKWFATPLKWFNIVFRPKKTDALFCSGLVYRYVEILQGLDHTVDWGMKGLEARTSSPRNEIDICFANTERYHYIAGVADTATP